jgi:hypothetical protein
MPCISLEFKKAWLSTALATALLVATSRCVFGQDFSRLSIPIPVDIESKQARCPLYFNLEIKSYNVPFDKFAAGPMNKAQTMFVTAVQAIRTEDAAKFASVWTSPDQFKRLDIATTVTLTDNSADNWIKVARSVFDFDNLNVVAEVLVGSDTMFIWESTTKSGTRRDAFYVGPDQKNQLRLSIASSNAPVMSLIEGAFVAAGMTGGDAYKPLPDINLQYKYPIPLTAGDPGAHPVFFEFDGSPMNFPLSDENVKPPTPLLEFLRDAAVAVRSGKYDAFANDFTPRSQRTVRQWLDSIESRKQSKQQSQSAGTPALDYETAGLRSEWSQNVKFVMNADPVFLVFQASTPGNNWLPENLTYSYVVREGGAYKIANFSSRDDLDSFLQSPVLFDKNILKSPP